MRESACADLKAGSANRGPEVRLVVAGAGTTWLRHLVQPLVISGAQLSLERARVVLQRSVAQGPVIGLVTAGWPAHPATVGWEGVELFSRASFSTTSSTASAGPP